MISRNLVRNFGIAFLIAGSLLVRPMALGNKYSSQGLVLLAVGAGLIWGTSVKRLIRWRPSMVGAIGLLLLVSAGIALEDTNDRTIKGFLQCLIAVVSFGALINDRLARQTYFNAFFYVLAMLAASSLVTEVLARAGDYSRLYIFSIQSERNQYSASVYFPFTLIYNEFHGVQGLRLRHSMFFVEPGIAPGFLSAGILHVIWTKNGFWRVPLLLAGLVLTRSSSGFTVLSTGLALMLLEGRRETRLRRSLLAMVTVVVGVAAFFYFPGIGYFDKSLTHSASFEDRIEYYGSAFEEMSLFGRVGTLVSGVGAFLVSCWGKSRRLAYLSVVLPVIVTGLFNVVFMMPLYFAFLMWDEPFFSSRRSFRPRGNAIE